MNPRKNISLIVGLAIPLLMIVLVALSIYLPNLFAPAPRCNFLYVTGENGYQGAQYTVEHGTLTKHDVKYPEHSTPAVVRLFVHDVSSNESREVSVEAAQQLRLDPSLKSPDVYEVAYGNGDSGFFPLFFSGAPDYNAVYLKGHNAGKKMNVQSLNNARYDYRDRAQFLGWIR